MAVKQKKTETPKKWRTAKKASVISWVAEALLLRDMEQAQALVIATPRFSPQEKFLLGKVIQSASLTYKHKYMGHLYAGN